MSSTPIRCIALTGALKTYVRAQVASGRYASASEVVRSVLRLMIEREEVILGGRFPKERSQTSRPSP